MNAVKVLNALATLLLAACVSAPPTGPVADRVVAPDIRKGESWTYQLRDGYNGMVLRTVREQVINHDGERFGISLTDAKLPAGDTVLYTAEANPVYLRAGRAALPVHYAPFKPDYVFPLEVGRHWQGNFVVQAQAGGRSIRATLYGQAVGWEHVSVPAGEFDALKIRRQIYLDDEEFWRWGTQIYETDWYVPAIKRFVKHEDKSEYVEKSGRYPNNIRRGDWSVLELTKYQPAG